MNASRDTGRGSNRPNASLVRRLERVRESLRTAEATADLRQFTERRESARNLLHYLAFRRFDLRREQARLAHLGLSSLGRSESHVLYNLESVLGWLEATATGERRDRARSPGLPPERGRALLAQNARGLLGSARRGRGIRILVTLPPEAALDYALVRSLVEAGMDGARINCAHDGPEAWGQMVAHIRRAERELGRRCWVEMDLAGPKLRTGAIEPGPCVLKVRPLRDAFGHVTSPASVWFVAEASPPGGRPPRDEIVVAREWLARRRRGDRVRLNDARGAHRTLRVAARGRDHLRLEVGKTTYLTSSARILVEGADGTEDATTLGRVAPREQPLHLSVGDRLLVTALPEMCRGPRTDRRGRVTRPAQISCTLPEALAMVRCGEPIWFDDGRLGGVVRAANREQLLVEITHAAPGGGSLRADKGINLPATELVLAPITERDAEDLEFIVRNADLVGYSFVHTASDLSKLREELSRLGRPQMGIVVKVETRRAFDELPSILFAALKEPPVGIMIARGDLAIEVGYDRLAEVQEEILWLCEAAHLPAIWATQVLEGLAKSGLPSRAEVTDAAMGERAECVMLNKGPHVIEALRALDSILRRMQSHQAKKTAMLRHLQVVERFFAAPRASAPPEAPVPRGPRIRRSAVSIRSAARSPESSPPEALLAR
ncbi:MAG: pyruvate kinase [Thermoplasmata archaeon]|nr:pyruvate kinase [Thermoplasmata archaeon]